MFVDTISELIKSVEKGQRLMGLDVGEKTIGIAIADSEHTIATAQETIQRSKFGKDAETLRKLVEARNIGGVAIGYPINMNGTEGPKCQSVRQFARNLHEKLALPTLLWDERMSTMAVTRMMDEAELSRNRKAALVDKLSASYILQGALDSWHRNT